MSIAGKFKTMPFPEQLQWLAQGEKTGTLVIQRRMVEKKVLFRKGVIISTSSSEPREYLGHFLISHGYITESQLVEVIRRQESSKALFGKVLLDLGGIAQKDLDKMLRLKAEETLFDIFSWTEGEFRFLDGELPTNAMVPLHLDVTGIVMEAMQRQDEWNRIREWIRTPRAIPVSISTLTGLKVEPGEEQILAAVNDERTVEEICLQTHANEFMVSRTLFAQVQEKRIKVVNPREVAQPVGASASPTSAGPAGPMSGAVGLVDSAGLLRLAQQLLEDKEYDIALRHYRAAVSLDPTNTKLRAAADRAEERIKSEVVKAGIVPTARPRLARPIEELMKLPLSPQDGFVISRLNGEYDVQTLQKISPMSQVETLIVLWRLNQAGHIEFKARSGPSFLDPGSR